MNTLRWEWVALGYYSYLLIVSLVATRFAAARAPVFAATVVCGMALGAQAWQVLAVDPLMFAAVAPLPVLLVGYWLSGLFFLSPMPRIERWLMSLDDRILRRPGVLASYTSGPRAVREAFEMAYVLVYPVIPAAVTTLAVGGHGDAVSRFWSTVLLAEFISYGMMPWLQTRPPRAIEPAPASHESPAMIRRFNGLILDRGSIQANTVPSGHAAGAVAAALAVADAMPVAGLVFLFLAAAIVVATVLGRYHYLVDSILGVLVALVVWYFCR